MNKLIIFLIAILAGTQTLSATIWRVNNNPGVSRDFVSIQDALNSSEFEAGDTIHVEGSVTPYDAGGVTITEKVHIIGPGYHLSINPETQHLKPSARVHTITFAAGSEGSVLAGIEQVEAPAPAVTITPATNPSVASITVAPASWVGVRLIINESNIRIINCKLNFVEIQTNKALSNIDIRKCWFSPGIVHASGTSAVQNLNIINNFFRNDGSGSSYQVINLHENVQSNIGNNTFYGGFQINAPQYCQFYNNVFYNIIGGRTGTALTTSSTNGYNGNISNITGLGGMVNGVNGNTIRTTETTEPQASAWFTASGGIAIYDRYFQINTSSSSPVRQAATAAGGSLSELSMFCGLSPYVLSGMTNIPAVYEIVMPSEVSSDGFEVTVRVRAY
jgi:hypothetical protein